MHAWKNLGYDAETKAYLEKMYGPDDAYDMGIVFVGLLTPEHRNVKYMQDTLTDTITTQVPDSLLKHIKRSRKFRDALRKNASSLLQSSKTSGDKAWQDLQKLQDQFPMEAPSGYHEAEVFADAGRGWNWVTIDGLECQDYEGSQMQHCGASWSTMYSLRDPKGKPHVTAEIDDTSIDQLKGKQNAIVAKKYWPACEKLFNVLVKNGGRPPKFKDSMYINDKLGEEFMIHMKERNLIQVPNMNGKNIEDVQNFEDLFDENPAQWNDNDIFGAN